MSAIDAEKVEAHRARLRKRGCPMAEEETPPTSQAAEWYCDVLRFAPCGQSHTAWNTARQIARLCGDDSEVTVPWRSLADAVGQADRLGRPVAYVQRGVNSLVESGWLEVETSGKGRGARTTFRLLPGERVEWLHLSNLPGHRLETLDLAV